MRPARPGDQDAVRAFFAGLTPSTRYLRFFTGAPPSGATMLRALCGDGDDIDVVVALEAGVIIGHAMAVDRTRPDGTRQADIGVVVAEERQNKGIGTALVRTLTARALARGTGIAVMDVLADNRRVLAMIRRRWPNATYRRDGISVTVNASLWGIGQATRAERAQQGRQKGPAGDGPRRPARHPRPRLPVGAGIS